jgi:hypothetical protein
MHAFRSGASPSPQPLSSQLPAWQSRTQLLPEIFMAALLGPACQQHPQPPRGRVAWGRWMECMLGPCHAATSAARLIQTMHPHHAHRTHIASLPPRTLPPLTLASPMPCCLHRIREGDTLLSVAGSLDAEMDTLQSFNADRDLTAPQFFSSRNGANMNIPCPGEPLWAPLLLPLAYLLACRPAWVPLLLVLPLPAPHAVALPAATCCGSSRVQHEGA